MPIGVIIDAASVLLGGTIGAVSGKYIPSKIKDNLTMCFGISSLSMGVIYATKVETLPAIMLAFVIGTIIGLALDLGKRLVAGMRKIEMPLAKLLGGKKKAYDEVFMNKFISCLILFCASGTGIFGAIESGMTGDHTALIAKAILDFFTAMIFASVLGGMVSLISIPQFLILILLFLAAEVIHPITNEVMRLDFTALGGMIMIATGFRIADIKNFPIVAMIPAMIVVMPISYLWTTYLMPLL